MKTRPIVHGTFTIERTYPVPPARVFKAFADPATKGRWFAEDSAPEVGDFKSDFKVGGREVKRFSFKGGTLQNDTLYMDIVPDQRIVFAYTMSVEDQRISASLATVELAPAGNGTKLTFTEQAAFFEGGDGPDMRKGGWSKLFERLGEELRKK